MRQFLMQRLSGTPSHLAVGDVVNYKGVEFSVSNTSFDGGFVDSTTVIEFGSPNEDLKRVKVALISSRREPELINAEEQHIITKYIRPFFLNKRYILRQGGCFLSLYFYMEKIIFFKLYSNTNLTVMSNLALNR